jgi:hypothetical protein
MRINLGSADRVARIILGLLLVVLAFVPALPLAASPILQWGAVIIGAVLIVTALVRFCPLYALFGLSTRKVSH